VRFAGGAKNIRAEQIRFEGTRHGIRVKANRDRGNDIGFLFFRDIEMKDVRTADYQRVLPQSLATRCGIAHNP